MSDLSAIAVEAYKKYILISLIHLGEVCYILSYLAQEFTVVHLITVSLEMIMFASLLANKLVTSFATACVP